MTVVRLSLSAWHGLEYHYDKEKKLFYKKALFHIIKDFSNQKEIWGWAGTSFGLFSSSAKKPPKITRHGPWGVGGLTNERPWTDHVITGPMRGLEKNRMGRGQTHKQHTNTQTDLVTTRPTQPRGPNWWKWSISANNPFIGHFWFLRSQLLTI